MVVNFVKSSNDYTKCPEGKLPEFAFIGRSNVGKSSLINMLAQKKGLAKTSSRPGKTQLINHFLVDEKWALVDLPGYGYARTSKSNRSHFEELIRGYILTRKNLLCLMVLIDSRLEPQKNDLEFLSFLGENGIPFAIIFTKTDKLGQNLVQSNVAAFKKAVLENWEELPPVFLSSAEKRIGRDEIIEFIIESIAKA